MKDLYIIKISDNIIANKYLLEQFLLDFIKISGFKILVHSSGGLPLKITDSSTYFSDFFPDFEKKEIEILSNASLINKILVAKLQAMYCDAIGLTGADAQCVLSQKRNILPVNFKYSGDVVSVNIDASFFRSLSIQNLTPVLSPITSDVYGNLLNMNANLLASDLAVALSKFYYTHLIYCSNKMGVMSVNDNKKVLSGLDSDSYQLLKEQTEISPAMIVKLENAFKAKKMGVAMVTITHVSEIPNIIKRAHYFGTTIYN